MNNFIEINEVGLRDGLQNQSVNITTQNKLSIAHALVEADIKFIEACSFVHPQAVPQMADAEQLIQALHKHNFDQDICYTALVPNMHGYNKAKHNGLKSIAIVISSTDTFNKKNLNRSLDEVRRECRAMIAQANKDKIKVRTYIAGACACPYEGKQKVDIIRGLVDDMLDHGSDEIAIADTTGAGSPAQINEIFENLLKDHPVDQFSIHLHDTRGQALAMAWEAIRLGIRKFDSSIAGLGGCPFAPGAKGNIATEDLVYMLHSSGYDTGINFHKLLEAIEICQNIIGAPIGGKVMPWINSERAKGRSINC